jgi:hypothetical protein
MKRENREAYKNLIPFKRQKIIPKNRIKRPRYPR